MNLLHVILFGTPGTDKGGGAPMIIFLVLMIVIFYFFMIRPQRKKEKDAQAFRANLQKGDKIVTIGGIHGKIVDVQEKTFTIETEGNSRMKIEKVAVSHTVMDEIGA
ncbi:MAG: preprotein translocase subunit YajC [Bacteroidales bacterium]|jgi:preprotein translocase subunit YajC|nr:preprotein translocase subunit YajC [Bacteroidales bacterium]